jgi:hypothetical protein
MDGRRYRKRRPRGGVCSTPPGAPARASLPSRARAAVPVPPRARAPARGPRPEPTAAAAALRTHAVGGPTSARRPPVLGPTTVPSLVAARSRLCHGPSAVPQPPADTPPSRGTAPRVPGPRRPPRGARGPAASRTGPWATHQAARPVPSPGRGPARGPTAAGARPAPRRPAPAQRRAREPACFLLRSSVTVPSAKGGYASAFFFPARDAGAATGRALRPRRRRPPPPRGRCLFPGRAGARWGVQPARGVYCRRAGTPEAQGAGGRGGGACCLAPGAMRARPQGAGAPGGQARAARRRGGAEGAAGAGYTVAVGIMRSGGLGLERERKAARRRAGGPSACRHAARRARGKGCWGDQAPPPRRACAARGFTRGGLVCIRADGKATCFLGPRGAEWDLGPSQVRAAQRARAGAPWRRVILSRGARGAPASCCGHRA